MLTGIDHGDLMARNECGLSRPVDDGGRYVGVNVGAARSVVAQHVGAPADVKMAVGAEDRPSGLIEPAAGGECVDIGTG